VSQTQKTTINSLIIVSESVWSVIHFAYQAMYVTHHMTHWQENELLSTTG
jgi:hypothetical protein